MIELINENKLAIAMSVLMFLHSSLLYYARPGKKSLKGYIRFVLTFGKPNEPKD